MLTNAGAPVTGAGGWVWAQILLPEATTSVPELSALVVAPAVGHPLLVERAGVPNREPAGSNELESVAAGHRFRHETGLSRAVPELPSAIGSPAVGDAAAGESAGVLGSRIMAYKFQIVATATGASRIVVELSPSCPPPFAPQQ